MLNRNHNIGKKEKKIAIRFFSKTVQPYYLPNCPGPANKHTQTGHTNTGVRLATAEDHGAISVICLLLNLIPQIIPLPFSRKHRNAHLNSTINKCKKTIPKIINNLSIIYPSRPCSYINILVNQNIPLQSEDNDGLRKMQCNSIKWNAVENIY